MMDQTEEVFAEVELHEGTLTLQLVRIGEVETIGDAAPGIYLKRPQQYHHIYYEGPLDDDQVAAFFTLFPNCRRS